MPELPEVETVARRLRRKIVGRRITGVQLLTPSTIRTPPPRQFVRDLNGSTVTGIGRRGKFLLIRLDPARTLVVHLRMTGGFEVVPRSAPLHAHTRVILKLGGLELRFIDQRRFGHMDLVKAEETFAPLQRMGSEPLERAFTLPRWHQILAGRRGTVKSLLLRQDLVAGIGNLYADEILWQARVHPARLVHTLRPEEIRRLHGTTRRVLRRAVLQVPRYGHSVGRFMDVREADALCPRCGHPLRTARIAGRTTYFCPRCQR
jgi:formamidopyrimidine-DNA glycosylase